MTNGQKMQDAFSRFDVLERRVDFAEGRAGCGTLRAIVTLTPTGGRRTPVRTASTRLGRCRWV